MKNRRNVVGISAMAIGVISVNTLKASDIQKDTVLFDRGYYIKPDTTFSPLQENIIIKKDTKDTLRIIGIAKELGEKLYVDSVNINGMGERISKYLVKGDSIQIEKVQIQPNKDTIVNNIVIKNVGETIGGLKIVDFELLHDTKVEVQDSTGKRDTIEVVAKISQTDGVIFVPGVDKNVYDSKKRDIVIIKDSTGNMRAYVLENKKLIAAKMPLYSMDTAYVGGIIKIGWEGRYITFEAKAKNNVPEIYVYDLQSREFVGMCIGKFDKEKIFPFFEGQTSKVEGVKLRSNRIRTETKAELSYTQVIKKYQEQQPSAVTNYIEKDQLIRVNVYNLLGEQVMEVKFNQPMQKDLALKYVIGQLNKEGKKGNLLILITTNNGEQQVEKRLIQ
ncbi:MAG: hypothetical protein QXV64_02990 [Candidatus Anstonellaceae archaeon]